MPRNARVRVTAPATAGDVGDLTARRQDEQSPADDVFTRALIRSQLKLALAVAIGFFLILLGIVGLLVLVPGIGSVTVLTVPLPWVVLGAILYPVICVIAAVYVRVSSRIEDRYRSLVDDRDDR